ncbi:mechanosensitive ion channel [Pusillimonas sp. TS35]|uniref:mechanosensitive ion channel domain-containing protein n=1 Tax=Paracandidimonas lactea TaxID=2895524 RepID=UPI00136E2420|nr:mechanosensitive ion channel domain-containing protein [Paracandidimonas lactea]MYN14800.1 mechanosensitive ion channel [Pusillimonas sp. TS35]
MHVSQHLARLIVSSGLLLVLALLAPTLAVAAPPAEPAASTAPDATAPAATDTAPAASYTTLANLLENDKARDQLIDELRTLAKNSNANASANATPTPEERTNEAPLTRRLALSIETFTTGLAQDFSQTSEVITSLATGKSLPGARLEHALPGLELMGLTIVAVLVAYFLLRQIARIGFAKLNVWIRQDDGRPLFGRGNDGTPPPGPVTPAVSSAPPLGGAPSMGEQMGPGVNTERRGNRRIHLSRKLIGVSAALVIDTAASLIAALVGYILLVSLSGGPRASTFALQFLSAFVMIELVKALSRGIFATRYDHLRLLPLSPEAANYWNLWLSRLISIIGYTLLVFVPVLQAVLLPSVGDLFSLLLMLGIYVYAARVVWTNRKTVRAGLLRHADAASAAVFGTLLRVLARLWHVLAILYFTVLLVVSQREQQDALEFMAHATLQSVVAIAVAMMLAAALTRLLTRPLTLPPRWRSNVPSLEARLNGYRPAILHGVRLFILAAATLVVLDGWRAFNLAAWLASESGRAFITHVLRIAIILAFAALAWTVLASIIEHRLTNRGARRATEREKTLLMLFRNAAAIVIATMTILIVLSQIGIDIGPLIAGAGVAGLAIGFGAQKLVQDVITGVFIQLENGMNQNDIVEVAGLFGTVEKITIRSVVIRTLDGGYHLIPFSVIDKVSNHTRDFGYHYGEYNIAHRESVDDAIEQLRLAFEDLKQDAAVAPEILEDIDIPGVTALNEQGFRIRVLIKTTPGNQWAVQRAFNRCVKQRFDEKGIEIPYPHTVLHFDGDNEGRSGPDEMRMMAAMR